MIDVQANRRIAHATVEAALKALVGTRLKTQSDATLRMFLAFKAIHRNGFQQDVDTPVIKRAVDELFTILPTPDGVPDNRFSGTIGLRGSQGKPLWMRNDAYRGAILSYAGPKEQGRFLFEDEDWRRPLRTDAVDMVAATLGGGSYAWPPRDVLAAIALRNERLDPTLGWLELMDVARGRFGLSVNEWEAITSAPALSIEPFDGNEWDPENLSADLRPPGAEKAEESRRQVLELPIHLAAHVDRVLEALAKHGRRAIVALVGVPGTSKSHVARIAARAFASEGCLREIQFSPGYTYEEFMEGPRYGKDMEVGVVAGAFLELNERALNDPGSQYVFLIEELTRADLPRVLGELLTYVEYRDEADLFTTMYRRDRQTRIAPNVAILATYNPADRSAVNVDAALLRRMRILDFPPDMKLLEEILGANGVDGQVTAKVIAMFEACRQVAGSDRFDETMPFGHAVFASVEDEPDLYELWHQELKRMLVRSHAPKHELFDTIIEHYPWHASPGASVVTPDAEPTPEVGGGTSSAAPDADLSTPPDEGDNQ